MKHREKLSLIATTAAILLGSCTKHTDEISYVFGDPTKDAKRDSTMTALQNKVDSLENATEQNRKDIFNLQEYLNDKVQELFDQLSILERQSNQEDENLQKQIRELQIALSEAQEHNDTAKIKEIEKEIQRLKTLMSHKADKILPEGYENWEGIVIDGTIEKNVSLENPENILYIHPERGIGIELDKMRVPCRIETKKDEINIYKNNGERESSAYTLYNKSFSKDEPGGDVLIINLGTKFGTPLTEIISGPTLLSPETPIRFKVKGSENMSEEERSNRVNENKDTYLPKIISFTTKEGEEDIHQYTSQEISAHQRALANGITNITSIEAADIHENITRATLYQTLAIFGTQILQKEDAFNINPQLNPEGEVKTSEFYFAVAVICLGEDAVKASAGEPYYKKAIDRLTKTEIINEPTTEDLRSDITIGEVWGILRKVCNL